MIYDFNLGIMIKIDPVLFKWTGSVWKLSPAPHTFRIQQENRGGVARWRGVARCEGWDHNAEALSRSLLPFVATFNFLSKPRNNKSGNVFLCLERFTCSAAMWRPSAPPSLSAAGRADHCVLLINHTLIKQGYPSAIVCSWLATRGRGWVMEAWTF